MFDFINFDFTAEPNLTTTSELRPPSYIDHYFRGPIKILIIWEPSEQGPLVNNDHILWVPKGLLYTVLTIFVEINKA